MLHLKGSLGGNGPEFYEKVPLSRFLTPRTKCEVLKREPNGSEVG
jgi:hypothetical protein